MTNDLTEPTGHVERRWTISAVECYLRGCNCSGCSMYDFFHNSPYKCQMKRSVLNIVKEKGLPTESQIIEAKAEMNICKTKIMRQQPEIIIETRPNQHDYYSDTRTYEEIKSEAISSWNKDKKEITETMEITVKRMVNLGAATNEVYQKILNTPTGAIAQSILYLDYENKRSINCHLMQLQKFGLIEKKGDIPFYKALDATDITINVCPPKDKKVEPAKRGRPKKDKEHKILNVEKDFECIDCNSYNCNPNHEPCLTCDEGNNHVPKQKQPKTDMKELLGRTVVVDMVQPETQLPETEIRIAESQQIKPLPTKDLTRANEFYERAKRIKDEACSLTIPDPVRIAQLLMEIKSQKEEARKKINYLKTMVLLSQRLDFHNIGLRMDDFRDPGLLGFSCILDYCQTNDTFHQTELAIHPDGKMMLRQSVKTPKDGFEHSDIVEISPKIGNILASVFDEFCGVFRDNLGDKKL